MNDLPTSAAPRTWVRRQVRETLLSAPAYRGLGAVRRRQLERDLAHVVEHLVEPLRPEGPPLATGLAVQNPLDQLPEQHADVSGKAAGMTGSLARTATDAVRFPAFVSSLIKGVFEAIVQSSIEQMEAFTTFLASVTRTTEQFERSLSPADTTNYLNQQFPGAGFSMAGLTSMLPGGAGSLSVSAPDKVDLTGWAVRTDQLNTPAGMKALTDEARFRLARQKQQMLATLVMMGLNRIVVTDGKINARVQIQVRSQEVAQQARQESVSGALRTDETITTHHHSFWGTSTSTETVPITIGVAKGTDATRSREELDTLTQLMGAVEVNFKSDVFPLEKLAAPDQLSLVSQAADPTQPGTRSPARQKA